MFLDLAIIHKRSLSQRIKSIDIRYITYFVAVLEGIYVVVIESGDIKSQLPLSASHRPMEHALNPLRQLNRLLRLTLSKDHCSSVSSAELSSVVLALVFYLLLPSYYCGAESVSIYVIPLFRCRAPFFFLVTSIAFRCVLVTGSFAKVFLRTFFHLV